MIQRTSTLGRKNFNFQTGKKITTNKNTGGKKSENSNTTYLIFRVGVIVAAIFATIFRTFFRFHFLLTIHNTCSTTRFLPRIVIFH